MPMERHVYFLLFTGCEGLALAGTQQAFHEANHWGGDYEIHNCGVEDEVITEQGLRISGLQSLPDPKELTDHDYVILLGYTIEHCIPPDLFSPWLIQAYERHPTMVCICTGAFFLGRAGLLDGRECTTHWKRCDLLQRTYPRAKVLQERLFVQADTIYTSGGGASCIDLALYLIERDHGPLMTAKAAREMVVYFRRDAEDRQTSVYLDYRNHLNPAIHALQDYLCSRPDTAMGLESLARLVGMSERNMTRGFRRATGISVAEYRTKIRLERAAGLLKSPDLTVDTVATRCGFSDARQLRRIWKRTYGRSPKSNEI